jgi:hypothetical protein
MSIQSDVYDNVEERGYRSDWTAAQFIARNIAKLGEELSEAGEEISCDALYDVMPPSEVWRDVFDNPELWEYNPIKFQCEHDNEHEIEVDEEWKGKFREKVYRLI